MKKRLRLLLINFLVLLVLLCLVEAGLWWQGYQPGNLYNTPWFKQVDELVPMRGFATDSNGIFIVDQAMGRSIADYVERDVVDSRLRDMPGYDGHQYLGLFTLGKDYVLLNQGKVDNAFSDYIQAVRAKTNPTVLDQAYLDYVQSPINPQGFRSIPFTLRDPEADRVFLLGDSFTWGHTTDNKTSSFADELAAKGYAVYNSGITCADLTQYRAIAASYLPMVQPRVVVLNLFWGNDISEFDRQISPNYPLMYPTNAGNIMACTFGPCLESAQEAYDMVIELTYIPQESRLNRWMSTTRVTTQLWQALTRKGWIDHHHSKEVTDFWAEMEKVKVGYGINEEHLIAIDQLCKAQGAQLVVSIIPEHTQLQIPEAELEEKIGGFPHVIIPNLEPGDYRNDGHFNEAGHQKYARFLDGLLREDPP